MSRVIVALAVLAMTSGPAMAQPANQMGERAFQRCYSCHSVHKGDTGLSGPNLDRLLGRPIAADKDFTYSEALRAFARKNRRWTRPLLTRFLTDPQALIRGNEMGFFGLKDAKEREAIVLYLAEDK